MCGILGSAIFGLDFARVSYREASQRAYDKLQHRGPDDYDMRYYCGSQSSASWSMALAHARLSIIDTSPAGRQPMESYDGNFTIVFNGEIYNYRELRDDLRVLGYSFKTQTDTEVLIAAWAQWGVQSLSRLKGMFAFAIYDRDAQTLTLVRDAFGIKPLFYHASDDNFCFASEIPALMELMLKRPALNLQRCYDYLVHGHYDFGTDSFFEGVQQLAPAHHLTVDLAKNRVGDPICWWRPSIAQRHDWTFPDAVEATRAAFLDNIRLHLRSDVPIGAALSGGVDSSAVVCAMRHVEPQMEINTFSFIASDPRVSEEKWVDHINTHIGARAHKVRVSPEDLLRDLDDMIAAQGEPFGSTSIYAQYRVFQAARAAGVVVTLDGQGADELLAGYNGYAGQRLRSLIETGRFGDALEFLNGWSDWPGRSKVTGIKAAAAQLAPDSLYGPMRQMNGDTARPSWLSTEWLRDRGVTLRFPDMTPKRSQKGRRVMAELAWSLQERGLTGLLRHGDRNSMRFSVESRVPFLTTDFAELMLSMPEEYLISQGGETKHVFRAAMRGIVPDVVLDRRDKIGFVTPELDWLRQMADTLREWLAAPFDLPFLDQEKLVAEFDLLLSGARPFSWQVWRWVNFCRWCQSVS
ncbi:asparagine synthase (glutamine-hydrolyzing) [Rhodobacteraceae bacterium XHP0102]|nr:asparagine synthase (glutamine-hydrolyzing) [Rhodobacteraceae bacterium XHP0102]